MKISRGPSRRGLQKKIERVTPYRSGSKNHTVEERIDEIVLSDDIHIEMMDNSSDHMNIGNRGFYIGAEKNGRLVIKLLWDAS